MIREERLEKDKVLTSKGNIKLSIILLICFAFPIYVVITNIDDLSRRDGFIDNLAFSLVVSFAGFVITYKMIPVFMGINYSKKIFGVDINKCANIKDLNDPDRKEVPESLGIVPATVFLVVSILSQTIITTGQLEFNASLLSICFMIFLGFADDILDLRWRYKLILPTIASIPLLVTYSGSTSILIPKILKGYFGLGKILNLGILFKIYMSLLAVFCTNAINIYAGINGLEVGQSLVIGFSIICYNLIEILLYGNIEQNIFSLAIMLPFVATSLALFMYNKFPAKCFIGDTFCYFAGMTFACVGIQGHYSKILLLFFIPQILNFLISLPQV